MCGDQSSGASHHTPWNPSGGSGSPRTSCPRHAGWGERQRERSPPRRAASMHVDTRVYCPVPGCPCSDPLRARGWRSVFSMQSHIDAHLAGTLAGHVPTTWMQQQQRQRCRVCGLSVSTRYGIHPTCRPEARASAAGRAEAHGANGRLPSWPSKAGPLLRCVESRQLPGTLGGKPSPQPCTQSNTTTQKQLGRNS